MNELCKEVRGIINCELEQAEEMRTHKYCKNLRIIGVVLTTLIVAAGIWGMYCVYTDIRWGFYAFLAFTLLSVVLFKLYQMKHITRLTRLTNNDCCVSKPLTAYAVVLQYSLLAMVALVEKDRDEIEKCIGEMETLVSQGPDAYVREAYCVISKYPAILDAEENGDYANMSELLELDDAKIFTLKKVSANYRLYKAAIVADLKEEAAKHLAYVLENGGDTFYKKELENVG